MSEDIAEYEEELKSVLQEMEALVAEDRAGGGNREEVCRFLASNFFFFVVGFY